MVEYNFNFKNSIFNKELIKEARQNAIRRESQKDISAQEVNEITNYLEEKCNNAGIFKDLTDEEIESRLKAEEQSPLKLIKNLINNKHKIDSSGVNPPQNDVSCHTEQSEGVNNAANQANSVILSAGEVSKNANLSGATQQLVESFTPKIGNSETAQELETLFTPTPVENRANATTSVSISDTDGAKQLTLAVGDKLSVTYVYKEKTFNYTIEAQSSQEITLQTEDGYLSVLGNNLAVQTGDVQYSNIALVGTTNSLKIGTNGKTYNANSIAYNSAEGGHSIYTWGDDPEPEADVTLSRGDNEVTLPLTYEEQVVMLTNPFTGQNYTYKIKARDITQYEYYSPQSDTVEYLESQKTVKLQFLANGRLVITGNYVDITAGAGQEDDLIVLGHFNNIRTGDQNDIVRVGKVVDATVKPYYYLPDPPKRAENGNKTERYTWSSTFQGKGGYIVDENSKMVEAYTAVGNHVDTGEGNDYVTLYFNKEDTNFTLDMGNGEDKLLFSNDAIGYNYSVSWADLTDEQKGAITGVETARGKYEDDTTIDGKDGWTCQNRKTYTLRDGACITLSLINCISQVRNGGNLSDYADIIDNKNGTYTVTFKNYNPPQGKTNTVTVSTSELRAVSGDLDSVVFATAIGKLALTNEPALANKYFGNETDPISKTGKVLAYVGNYRTDLLSLYVFGNSNYCDDYITSKTRFLNIASHYLAENGDLSNLIVCNFNKNGSDSPELGLDDGHAYTLKDINIEGNYVTLINPQDDNDCVRFDIDEILKYKPFVRCYGYTTTQVNAFFNKPFQG